MVRDGLFIGGEKMIRYVRGPIGCAGSFLTGKNIRFIRSKRVSMDDKNCVDGSIKRGEIILKICSVIRTEIITIKQLRRMECI